MRPRSPHIPATPVLSLRSVSKAFSGVRAIEDIDLDLYPGEALGLVGDNGAGKSTLTKVLSGVCAPDTGRLFVNETEISFKSYGVRQARLLGIETVHQNGSLGEKQPLWRNVFLGRPMANRLGFIRVHRQKRITADILNRHVGLRSAGISPDARVQTLSGGERQGLAMGRAMHFQSRIIILDEPTTALSLNEVDRVLTFVDQIVAQGKACIYISHNMAHVHRVASRIVLMDKGKIITECRTRDISVQDLGLRLIQVQNQPEGDRA